MQPTPTEASKRAPLTQRLKRLLAWFGGSRGWWAMALGTALIAALTEPLMPALLKPLLDRGFTAGQLPLWQVPVFAIGLFLIRGMAQFCSQYALARIANNGMQRLRRMLFADGKIDEGEKRFLADLRTNARQVSPEFQALYDECLR